MKKYVLGVKIDDVNMEQAIKVVEKWLENGKKHYIVTPNPEIVMMARSDKRILDIINKADLAIPDGKGLRLTGDIVCHIPGIDFMEELIKLSSEKGFTIGLLGARDGVAERCAKCLLRKYPKLNIVFAENGGEVDNNGNVIVNKRLPLPHHMVRDRNDDEVDILFVAFGPPKQEKWIAKNLPNLDVKVAMGVGGAFDYLSGRVQRAPIWIRNLGFEWLFRLILQPWRIKRQFALLKYVWYLIRNSKDFHGDDKV
ncbi:MAG: WecB/TagA/CpsF family glycosyltransferase [Patescibacteria group bacterium]